MSDIYQLIATVNPDRYYAGIKPEKEAFKKLIRQIGFDKAADKAKPTSDQEFKIVYDSNSETLEPVYFWILDFMNGVFGGKVDKIVDNFTATSGSEDFLRSMDKAKRMQDSAMNIYGTVNTVIKSVQNIIYDLKEFQIRLADYDNARSSDPKKKDAGLITLKQIWMDQVDIKKGRGSINMLAQDLSFVTIRDAFMVANDLNQVEKLDLNDRVKRILSARLQEFLEWKDRSESELRKRFAIEKTYLRTQVDAVKMYSRWARPYLKAAEELRMNDQNKYKADLVKAFNTLYFQLTLFGQGKLNVPNLAINKSLPPGFANLKLKRDYFNCVLVDFTFRGIPSRVGQNFAFGGRVEINLKAYALNKEELDLIYNRLDKSDFSEALKLVEGMTTETLEQLKGDIDEFLEEKTKEKTEEKVAEGDDINPFAALIGLSPKSKTEKPKDDKAKENERIAELAKGIKPDTYVERFLREQAHADAKKNAFTIYDIYKKSHGMASVPIGDQWDKKQINVSFTQIFKR